jgi:phycocyanin alpha chain
MFNRSISRTQAMANNGFVTKSDLEIASSRFRRANAALKAAKKLTDCAEVLTAAAQQAADEQYSQRTAPDGSVASQNVGPLEQDSIGAFLRVIEYCLIAGRTDPLDDYLSGHKEKNNALNLTSARHIAELQYIRENHRLDDDEALEANFYIDYAINALR